MRSVKSFVFPLLILLVISVSIANAEEILLRDEWYVIEMDGTPAGYGNDKCFKTEEGYYYHSFFEMNLDFLGFPYVQREQIESWVDDDFRLTKVLRISDSDGARTTHEAKFVYGTEETVVEIATTDTTEQPKQSSLTLEGYRPLYSTASFLDKIISTEGLTVNNNYFYESWNYDEVLSIFVLIEDTSAITYEGQEISVFKIHQDAGSVEAVELIDSKGNTYKTETLGLELVFHKVEPGNIPELETAATDVLLVPGNMTVEHPFRVTSSLITVKWEDLPADHFSWEDNRQRVAHAPGDYSVQLAIEREERDFTGKIQLPVTNPEFALYLADTDYINPSSPQVQSLVEELLGGEKDAWKASQLILDWIYTNITNKMVARNLTTNEILADKTGKCAEYATLFAAMARAAGLPTKVVFGERYIGNLWIAHLWNEVWLGEWVAIDASHNQIAPDAMLIKLADSNTIKGTLDVRLRLVNRLEIIIEDVEIAAAKGAPDFETGCFGGKYYNAEYLCEITVPKGWVEVEGEEQGCPTLLMQNPADLNFSAILMMSSVPPGTRAEQLMAAQLLALPSVFPDFVLLEEKTGLLSGEKTAVASWVFSEEPLILQECHFLVKGDVAYMFIFAGIEENWEKYQDYIEKVLDGFITYL